MRTAMMFPVGLAVALVVSLGLTVSLCAAAEETEGDSSHAATDTEHGTEDSAAHGDAEGHGAEGHGDAHHNPHDLSHANAGNQLEDITEVRHDLAIWTFVVFVLLLAILLKFAWGPIIAALEKRENRIASDLEEARRSNEEAKRLLAEHENKLAAASEEVRGMLDQARRDADVQKQAIVDEAHQAAKAEKERALREINAAKNEALRELADKSVGTAVDLAGRIVQRQLSQEDHAQLIQEALSQFPSKN